MPGRERARRRWTASGRRLSRRGAATLLIFLAPLTTAQAQTQTQIQSGGRDAWQAERRVEGANGSYAVLSRQTEGSAFRRYRLEGRVDEPLERVVAALRAIQADDRFLQPGERRTVLDGEGSDRLVLLRIDAPMVADRELVLRTEGRFEADGSYRFSWRGASEEGPPAAHDAVRVHDSDGFWLLTPVASGVTRVVYETFSEAGSMPAWIVDRIVSRRVGADYSALRALASELAVDVAAPPPRAIAKGDSDAGS